VLSKAPGGGGNGKPTTLLSRVNELVENPSGWRPASAALSTQRQVVFLLIHDWPTQRGVSAHVGFWNVGTREVPRGWWDSIHDDVLAVATI
jgi:hypothetical protein